MDITAEKLQYLLDDAWYSCPAAANSLREQLFLKEKSVRSLASLGSIASVSKNGASHAYFRAGLGTYTPDQIGDAYRMLINFYDRALQWAKWFVANPPAVQPTWWTLAWPINLGNPQDYDEMVYNHMVWQLVPCEEYQTDVTDLRLHPVLVDGAGNTEVWSW